MSRSILTRMPAGFVGDVTRKNYSILEPNILGADCFIGGPVKLSGGKIVPVASGDPASAVYGFLVRPYPTQGGISGLTAAGAVPAGTLVDIMRSGYMAVLLALGTAAKGGIVHMRVTAATGKAVGDLEVTADPATLSIAGVAGTNTGNGTIGTLSVASPAKVGVHTVTFTAATAFTVKDPNGLVMGTGATGTAFSAGGVTFTITAGGTAFVAGDTFNITVTESAPGNVELPATFTGPADADGNVEIAYNI